MDEVMGTVDHEAVKAWIESARNYLLCLKAQGTNEVSVNTLFEGIQAGKCPAPPSNAGLKKRGSIMGAVFQGVDYWVPTGKMVAGINPASKGRKVMVWRFRLEGVEIQAAPAINFMNDTMAW